MKIVTQKLQKEEVKVATVPDRSIPKKKAGARKQTENEPLSTSI